MNLYQIDRAIEDLIESSVDHLTGEISTEASARLDDLIKEQKQKILNAAKFIKNRTAFVDAMRSEIKKLSDRIRSEESKMEWLEGYAKSYMVHGEKYEDSQCVVSLRRSFRVEVIDLNLLPQSYKKEKIEISPDKKAIGEAIKTGLFVDGAQMIESYSLQIK